MIGHRLVGRAAVLAAVCLLALATGLEAASPRKRYRRQGAAPESAAAKQAPTPTRVRRAKSNVKVKDPDEKAKLVRVDGFVEVRRKGRKKWQEVKKPGLELAIADRLHTYGDSRAVLSFHEQSEVVVEPFSIFSVEKAKFSHIAIGLFQGKVRCSVSWRATRRFEVRAPKTAVLARAEEDFTVASTSDGRVTVEVRSGDVWVYTASGKRQVRAGEGVEVVGGRLGEVRAVETVPAAAPAAAEGFEKEEARVPPEKDGSVEKAEKKEAARKRTASAGTGPLRREGLRDLLRRELGRTLQRDSVESAAAFGMKTALHEEGKILRDASGARVRVEEYVTRPDPLTFKVITLNKREARLDYNTFEVEVNRTLPADLADAGNLFYRSGAAQPFYWAVKYRWVRANATDEVSQIGVDGDSLAVGITPNPVYDPVTGGYTAPAAHAAHQTLFGNVYEFVNGGTAGTTRIYDDAAFRPADNGVLLGTGVTGMLARLQPIQVMVRDAAAPGTILATYYDYAYLGVNPADASGNGTGKGLVVDFSMPTENTGQFVESRYYVNFRDTNGNGILDFPEQTEAGAGCRYGNCAVANVFHDKMSRLDGTAAVALAGAGCQGTTAGCVFNVGDTQFFADTNHDSLITGGEATIIGVTGPTDANLLAFAAQTPRDWMEVQRSAVDDFGSIVRTDYASLTGGVLSSNYDIVADQLEGNVLHSSLTSSLFGGTKLDLVLTPSLYLSAGLILPDTETSECPAAGSQAIPQ